MLLSQYVLIGLSGVAAGGVNAIAGGGTLISFPMLTAVGIPVVAANVTNTVALCPGYIGATLAQLRDLRGQRRRLLTLIPGAVVGGMLGGVLLLLSGERTFRALVPWLILSGSALLAVQEPVRSWLVRRAARTGTAPHGGMLTTLSAIALAAVYGGYFGAGLSVIVLAVLGVTQDDTLTRLNALKQALAFSINIAAATLFLFSLQVVWPAALVMAAGALAGGALGGKLAGKIRPSTLRKVVVVTGTVIGTMYLLRGH